MDKRFGISVQCFVQVPFETVPLTILTLTFHSANSHACRVDETDQTRPYLGGGVLDDGVVMHMRYVLPDIACEHAVLQMRYRESTPSC